MADLKQALLGLLPGVSEFGNLLSLGKNLGPCGFDPGLDILELVVSIGFLGFLVSLAFGFGNCGFNFGGDGVCSLLHEVWVAQELEGSCWVEAVWKGGGVNILLFSLDELLDLGTSSSNLPSPSL